MHVEPSQGPRSFRSQIKLNLLASAGGVSAGNAGVQEARVELEITVTRKDCSGAR
jgi:hypothetical protein